MNMKTETDKQFDLIVEDFYDDDAAEYSTATNGRSDVFFLKLALILAAAMAAIIAFAFIIQYPITIPAAVVAAVTFIVYRNMATDYAKKENV